MINFILSFLLLTTPAEESIRSATVLTINSVQDEACTVTQKGSGTIIWSKDNEFYVLSCAHCFRYKDKVGQGKMFVSARNQMDYVASLQKYDEARDLALLRIRAKSPYFPAKIAAGEVFVPGTRLLKSGFPNGGPHLFSRGECLPRFGSKNNDTMQVLLADFYATHGDSGGGVYRTSDNCLIGVLFGGIPNASLCVRLEDIRFFLKGELP